MSHWLKQEGFAYQFDPGACKRCEGRCCTGESGYIWVSSAEIAQIASFLEISSEFFVRDCLKKEGYRYTIKEVASPQGGYECLFFDRTAKKCTIYPVRPNQCRTFPFWNHFKENIGEVLKECPGIRLP